tara:strand:+ start:1096 stop:2343 length:1248 start_codon:yes stop_codon:yes gene_type:complete
MGTKKNTDTVPAMLTPGEFVIKRDSAQKIGYDALELMNETGKVPDMKKHGGKMAGYLKNKFLNGMLKGYQEGGEVDQEGAGRRSMVEQLLAASEFSPDALAKVDLSDYTPHGTYSKSKILKDLKIDPSDSSYSLDTLSYVPTDATMEEGFGPGGGSLFRVLKDGQLTNMDFKDFTGDRLARQIQTIEQEQDIEDTLRGSKKRDPMAELEGMVDPNEVKAYKKEVSSLLDERPEAVDYFLNKFGVIQKQEGGPVPFQISPNATLSRRPTQIDVEPSTGGLPINIMNILERTGPGATTPGPFTGSSEKNMIDGLINYIMSPDYDSRTGKHKKPKQKMEEISTFGSKSATADSALKAGQNVKQQAITGSRMQQKMFENELMGIGAAAVKNPLMYLMNQGISGGPTPSNFWNEGTKVED